jgi:hypothetical protein
VNSKKNSFSVVFLTAFGEYGGEQTHARVRWGKLKESDLVEDEGINGGQF